MKIAAIEWWLLKFLYLTWQNAGREKRDLFRLTYLSEAQREFRTVFRMLSYHTPELRTEKMRLIRITFIAIICINVKLTFASNTQQEIDSVMNLAYEFVFDHPSLGLKMSLEALSDAQEINYSRGIAESSLALAIYYRRNGEFDESIKYLNKGDSLREYLLDGKMNEGILAWYQGEVFENIGDVEQAEQFFIKALEYYRLKGKVDQEITSKTLFGVFYGRRGYFEEALAEFTDALDMLLEADTTVERTRGHLVHVYNDLGMLYNLTGEPEKAKNFSRLSIQIAKRTPSDLPPLYNTLAQIDEATNNVDSALINYRKSYSLAEEYNLSKYVAATATDISRLFSSKLNQPDSALFYLKRAAEVTSNLSDVRQTSLLNYSIAKFYFEISRYDRAYQYATKGLETFHDQKDHIMLKNSYEIIWQTCKIDGRLDEALTYYELYKSYSDSVLNSSNEKSYSNLRVRLETMEKQKKVENLQSELNAKRIQLLATTVIVGLLIVLAFIYWLWTRAENKRKEVIIKYSKLQQHNAEEKLKFKEQELADYMLQMIRKKKFIEEIEELVNKNHSNSAEYGVLSRKLTRTINQNKLADRDWDDFTRYFGQVHSGFFDDLKGAYPDLSAGELRYCALFRMNLSLKETSEIMSVDPSSVKVARYRIRKKMGLSKADNLHSFLSIEFPSELHESVS